MPRDTPLHIKLALCQTTFASTVDQVVIPQQMFRILSDQQTLIDLLLLDIQCYGAAGESFLSIISGLYHIHCLLNSGFKNGNRIFLCLSGFHVKPSILFWNCISTLSYSDLSVFFPVINSVIYRQPEKRLFFTEIVRRQQTMIRTLIRYLLFPKGSACTTTMVNMFDMMTWCKHVCVSPPPHHSACCLNEKMSQ